MSTKSVKLTDADEADFPLWFRHFRRRHKLTAVAISNRAGLNPGYVSDLERGKVQPKSVTIDRISDAMGLSAAERAELHRRAFSQKPAKVDVPGLAIWKHLPTAIFQVEHKLFELYQTDEVLPDTVRFFSGLLGCVALHRGLLTRDRRRALFEIVDPPLSQLGELVPAVRSAGVSVDGLVNTNWSEIRRRLIIAWRQVAFADADAADSLVSLLSEWVYQLTGDRSQPQFSAFFSDKKLDRSFGTNHAPLRRTMYVYDFFTAEWLLADSEIASRLAQHRPPQTPARGTPDARFVLKRFKMLARLAAMTPDQLYLLSKRDRNKWLHLAPADRLFRDMDRMACLFELPPSARRSFPSRAECRQTRKAAAAVVDQVEDRIKRETAEREESTRRRLAAAEELRNQGLETEAIIRRLDELAPDYDLNAHSNGNPRAKNEDSPE